MIGGLALGGTGAAVAQEGDNNRDRQCSIELDRDRNTLTVDVNTSARNARHFARVSADFDTRRDRGDNVEWVRLDRRGDAEGIEFRIPRRADSVDVTVRVGGTRISCDESLELDRRVRL
jgi:hypothetical protein